MTLNMTPCDGQPLNSFNLTLLPPRLLVLSLSPESTWVVLETSTPLSRKSQRGSIPSIRRNRVLLTSTIYPTETSPHTGTQSAERNRFH